MDAILDTDIANIFGKIGKVVLLKELFPESSLFICSAVRSELERANLLGYKFVENVFHNTNIIEPTKREIKLSEKILSKRNIGKGEAESISIAKTRKMILLTNDRIAIKEASIEGVNSLNLPTLLRQMWKKEILLKESVKSIVSEMEEKCNVKFLNTYEIFRE